MDEQAFKFANHPRERVSGYQAMAFCRWFSWRLGGGYDLKKVEEWAVRLPTEFEWEKAARGADGWIYPCKGYFDASKGNTYETDIGQTSAVGIFPNGESPLGNGMNKIGLKPSLSCTAHSSMRRQSVNLGWRLKDR